MATVYKVHEAKTHLSKLLEMVERGEEVTIARGSQPVARIVPFEPSQAKPKRVFGRLAGQFAAPPEAFAPLTDDELKDWGC